jgi:hypothetical protein
MLFEALYLCGWAELQLAQLRLTQECIVRAPALWAVLRRSCKIVRQITIEYCECLSLLTIMARVLVRWLRTVDQGTPANKLRLLLNFYSDR